jgi:hypothetical protein
VVANWCLRTHAKVPQLDQPLTFSSAKTAGIFIHVSDELLNTLAEGVIRLGAAKEKTCALEEYEKTNARFEDAITHL